MNKNKKKSEKKNEEKKLQKNDEEKILNKKRKREKKKNTNDIIDHKKTPEFVEIKIENKQWDSNKNNIINKNEQILEFKCNPEKINFVEDVVYDIYINSYNENTFTIFKSFNKITYLIYATKKDSIITFNLNSNEKVNEIKKFHKVEISNLGHCPDYIKKKDLILSVSASDNNIKVWDFPSFKCLYDFKNINKNGYLNVACFLNDNNQIYIVTSNYRFTAKNVNPIKIFDLKGKEIKQLKDSDENTSFVSTYYDKKSLQLYVIAGHSKYVRAYNFKENKVYKTYKDKYNKYHNSVIVYDKEEIIKLMESSGDGYLRIWDFHEGKLLNRIKVDENIYGLCLWNKDYIFVGCHKLVKLVNLNTEKVILELVDPDKSLSSCGYGPNGTIRKFIHPILGECLLFVNKFWNQMKLWGIKN